MDANNFDALEFNMKMLISEVKSRPAIWDMSSGDYKDRPLKKRSWNEIARLIVPDFDNLPHTEKLNCVKSLHLKWRNVRDNYKRNLKIRKLVRGGCSNVKKKKRYIFAKDLAFLSKNETAKSKLKNKRPVKLLIAKDKSDSSKKHTHAQNSKPLKDQQSFDDLQDSESYSAFPSGTDTSDDEDELFFGSVLPMVQNLDTDQKLEFRMGVLDVLKRVKNRQLHL